MKIKKILGLPIVLKCPVGVAYLSVGLEECGCYISYTKHLKSHDAVVLSSFQTTINKAVKEIKEKLRRF
jgi:hypothetical protein